jgi:hypothetical protein
MSYFIDPINDVQLQDGAIYFLGEKDIQGMKVSRVNLPEYFH